jgi:thiol-disulfide isomerase/thioredoxin
MIERVLIAIVLLVVGYCAYQLFQRATLRRARENVVKDPLLQGGRPGVAKVLYFTTPFCAPCKYAQRPALDKLQTEMGSTIEIIQVDATQDPEAATRWNVQTVPTTFVLDETGEFRTVNHGVADYDTLRRQLLVS